jgi:type I restriction enzyme S subunit
MTFDEGRESTTSRLGDLLELIIDYRGKTPKKLGGDFVDAGIPVISAIHIKRGKIIWSERERFVTTEMFQKWMKEPLKKGDVLLTSEAPLGEVAMVPSDADLVLSQRLFALRTKSSLLDPKYLMYFLQSNTGQEELRGRSSGSTVVGIKQTELVNIPIPCPPILQQRLIGEILMTIDEKISENEKVSETLEDIASTVFKSWFVDFDPVKAKMSGKKPAGMSDDVVELFPDSMEEVDGGLLPKGWTHDSLSKHISVTKGKSYKSSELEDSETALVTLKSFARGGGYRFDGLKAFSGGYKSEQVVEPGELVVSFTDVTQAADVIGKPAIVLSNPQFSLLVASLDVGIVRPKSTKVGTYFLNQLFLTPMFNNHVRGYTNGTTVLHLGKGALEDFMFPLPSIRVLQAFEEFAKSIFSQIQSLYLQNLNLQDLRDSLLPRLISGELQIPEKMLA